MTSKEETWSCGTDSRLRLGVNDANPLYYGSFSRRILHNNPVKLIPRFTCDTQVGSWLCLHIKLLEWYCWADD